MTDPPKDIPEKIRRLRERFGFTLEEAKEALLICLGSTLDEHQEALARQLEDD
jgi:hypothetical protein